VVLWSEGSVTTWEFGVKSGSSKKRGEVGKQSLVRGRGDGWKPLDAMYA